MALKVAYSADTGKLLNEKLFLQPMKKTVFLFAAACALVSCKQNGAGEKQEAQAEISKAGQIIAVDSMAIEEDELNRRVFSVSIITTTESGSKGKYDIDASCGFNEAHSGFAMPKGGEQLQPVLRRGTEPYTYVVGFYNNDDTVFHEYYSISAANCNMMMKYIKAYVFQ